MMVAKSVSQYIRAGVAGFHLEDQVLSKRCGTYRDPKQTYTCE